MPPLHSHAERKDEQRCVRNPDFIKNLIASAPEASTWTYLDRFSTKTLLPTSSEYKSLLEETPIVFPKNNDQKFNILQIKRIENPALLAAFVLKRYSLEIMLPKMKVSTKTVFFLTGLTTCERTIREGFDWRLRSVRKDGTKGCGISFSPSCKIALNLVKVKDGLRNILVCHMLQRKSDIHCKGPEVLPTDADTVLSISHNSFRFVKYDDHVVYPAYMVTCKVESLQKPSLPKQVSPKVIWCVRNTSLISTMIRNVPETSKWRYKDRFHLEVLDKKSVEYVSLTEGHIPVTFPSLYGNKQNRILNITRIENPELMAAFDIRRNELRQMVPMKKVETRVMFHATSLEACNKIIREGFDWRLSASKKGDKWGHGISLSPSCRFVTHFTKTENGFCYLLVCHVLIRNTMHGSPGLSVPLHDFDTTKSKRCINDVYVKYHDCSVYPAYLIQYEPKKKQTKNHLNQIEEKMRTLSV